MKKKKKKKKKKREEEKKDGGASSSYNDSASRTTAWEVDGNGRPNHQETTRRKVTGKTIGA